MKKFVFTAAMALVLATSAYAQGRPHGGGMSGGMGGGGGMSAGAGGGFRGPGTGGGFAGSAGANFNARTSGPSMGAGTMGRGGPTGGLYNSYRSPSGTANFERRGNVGPNGARTGAPQRNFANGNQRRDFASGNQRRTFNYAGPNRGREFNRRGNANGAAFRKGLASGNFFEHGRRFRFRRFWGGQWVFLNDWNDCTAWAWIHVAPGIWAWRPINVCIG
jgi:hypothetical protein